MHECMRGGAIAGAERRHECREDDWSQIWHGLHLEVRLGAIDGMKLDKKCRR